MYVGYFWESVTITDANPALDKPIQATLTGEAMKQALQVNYSHHGLTDTLILKLPEAQYVIGMGKLEASYTKAGTLNFPLSCLSLPDCGKK